MKCNPRFRILIKYAILLTVNGMAFFYIMLIALQVSYILILELFLVVILITSGVTVVLFLIELYFLRTIIYYFASGICFLGIIFLRVAVMIEML